MWCLQPEHLYGRSLEEPSQPGIQSTGEIKGLHWAGGSDMGYSVPSHAWLQMLHCQMNEGMIGGEEGGRKES